MKIFIFLALALVLLEISLRYYGFCDAVLFHEDSDFEYLANPNQNRFRYGNQIKYNAYSMRSEEVDSSAYIILGFGDSIINGGQQTGNNELATSILSDSLSIIYGRKIQFLNVAEKSWGPDNCFQYLKKYGRFRAHEIYLFVSSSDAHDSMTFQKVVGVNKDYPSKQYALALFELVDRYMIGNNETENKKDSILNNGFASFLTYSRHEKIPLTIYLHADAAELAAGAYNEEGKEIIKFANENKVPLILDIENGLSASDFRDNLHLNASGQKRIAEIIINHRK